MKMKNLAVKKLIPAFDVSEQGHVIPSLVDCIGGSCL